MRLASFAVMGLASFAVMGLAACGTSAPGKVHVYASAGDTVVLQDRNSTETLRVRATETGYVTGDVEAGGYASIISSTGGVATIAGVKPGDHLFGAPSQPVELSLSFSAPAGTQNLLVLTSCGPLSASSPTAAHGVLQDCPATLDILLVTEPTSAPNATSAFVAGVAVGDGVIALSNLSYQPLVTANTSAGYAGVAAYAFDRSAQDLISQYGMPNNPDGPQPLDVPTAVSRITYDVAPTIGGGDISTTWTDDPSAPVPPGLAGPLLFNPMLDAATATLAWQQPASATDYADLVRVSVSGGWTIVLPYGDADLDGQGNATYTLPQLAEGVATLPGSGAGFESVRLAVGGGGYDGVRNGHTSAITADTFEQPGTSGSYARSHAVYFAH